MNDTRRKAFSLIMTLMLIAAGLLGGCANNHPIDESKLPDLESQQQQQQETQMQEQQEQEQPQQNDNATSDNSEGASNNAADGGSPSGESGTSSETLISESEAVGIILARVPGASENDVVSFEKDYDYGRWIYEGEIRYEGLEYDFAIDAQTGNILEWEIDD